MRLRFLGKNSTPTNSPTLYATDRDSYVVQGWIITDPDVLARHDLPEDETLVEVPPALLKYLSRDGLYGVVSRRWLPRERASTLLLPGNDYWMFDRRTVVFTHFSGEGHVLGHEITRDPGIVATCASAFDAAWKIATPHIEYEPT